MQKFLLLRNNKQSGPYSVEDLKQMGLKAYDLIWVEGKSAAWRYPGEVDELKSFAPPVEEQPYDRFYKRPVEEIQKKNEPATAKVESIAEPKIESRVQSPVNVPPAIPASGNTNFQPKKEKEKEYKRIFVTLPATAEKSITAPAEPVKAQEQPPVIQPKKESPAIAPVEVEAEPLISIKEKKYVRQIAPEVYFPDRKTKSRRMWVLGGIGAGVVALIAIGIFIGFALQQPVNKDTGKQETEKVYRVSNDDGKTDQSATANNSHSSIPVLIDSSGRNPYKQKKLQDSNIAKTKLLDSQQKPLKLPTDSNQLGIGDEKPKAEAAEKKEKPMPNLGKFVSVANNDYQVGPFGGISKLQLTVRNRSEYDIDLVVVELQYLKVNKEVFKTETVYFRDIAANSSLTVNAPKSSRGNKINYKVTLISSKDHLFHASDD